MNGTINNPNSAAKINWAEAERVFMYDPSVPSVAEVARRFKVSYLTCHKYATKRNWLRRRPQVHQQLHDQAVKRLEAEFVLDRIQRLRRLSRLVDNALDDAVVNPSTVLPHVIRLIAVERDVMEGLPPHQSRERLLREHVERALGDAGMLKQEANHG